VLTGGEALRAESEHAVAPAARSHGVLHWARHSRPFEAGLPASVGAGPRAVASRRDHRSLLEAAGFIEIEEGDVTDEFLATAERWVRFSRQLEPELRALQGAEAFDEVQLDRETILGAIREGLLSRSLFVAMRP